MLGLTHAPAAQLAERLVEIAPPGLERVFFSDSGSAATEIALKMAFQYWQQQGGEDTRRTSFVSLTDAYHGDTVGAVSVGGIDLFHSAYGPLLFDAHHVPAGRGGRARASARRARTRDRGGHRRAAGSGRGGHPRSAARVPRRRQRALCDRHGVFLICDEVATGFGRTGTMFACEQERVSPDFLCVGKGLTGGYLPLAATLATERIYEGFLGAHEDYRTFFHGHTFTGNPLACAAGIASLEAFDRENTLLRLQPKMRLLGELLEEVAAMPEVAEVRGRGFMVGIDLGEHEPALRMGHRVTVEARERGAIIRPLGDTMVLMPPLAISKAELSRLVAITAEAIAAAHASAYGERGQARAADSARRQPGRRSRLRPPGRQAPAGRLSSSCDEVAVPP